MAVGHTPHNAGAAAPRQLSAAILADDANLCALLQHTLALSHDPQFNVHSIAPANWSAATFLQHSIVFIDRLYGGNSYIDTLHQHLSVTDGQRKPVVVVLLDEQSLADDLTTFTRAVRLGADQFLLKSDLSLKNILHAIDEARGTNAFSQTAGRDLPVTSARTAGLQQAAENIPSPEPIPNESGTDSLTIAVTHHLSLDIENQRAHLDAVHNSPLVSESDIILSITEWLARLDHEGVQTIEQLIRRAINYEPVGKHIACQMQSDTGAYLPVTITEIQIKNNGQGTVVGISAQLTVQAQTADNVLSTVDSKSGFDNLGDSSHLPIREKTSENILRSLPMMCLLLDESGHIAGVANSGGHSQQIFPHAEEGQRLSDLLEIESLDNLVETISRTLNTGKEHQQTIAYASEQGLRWLDTHITRLKGDSGLSRQVVWTAFDITATRHSYQELLKNHDALSQLLDGAPVLFFQKDSAGRFQRANAAFCELFGVRADVISGRSDQEVFRDTAQQFTALIQSALSEPAATTTHSYNENINGQPCTFYWQTLSLTKQASNQIDAIVGFGFARPQSDQAPSIDTVIDTAASDADKPSTHNKVTELAPKPGIEMSGAVGQDFKAILNGIVNYTEIALSHNNKRTEQQITEHLDEVVRTATRAKELVSHNQENPGDTKEAGKTALQPLIQEMIEMIRPTLPSSLNLKTELEKTSGKASIGDTAFKKIVMQLLVSARNSALAAQTDDNPQEIVLSLNNLHLADTRCTTCSNALDGDFIALTVRTRTDAMSRQDFDKLVEAARSATQRQLKDNVVAMAHNNQGHAIIDHQQNTLSLQLLFART